MGISTLSRQNEQAQAAQAFKTGCQPWITWLRVLRNGSVGLPNCVERCVPPAERSVQAMRHWFQTCQISASGVGRMEENGGEWRRMEENGGEWRRQVPCWKCGGDRSSWPEILDSCLGWGLTVSFRRACSLYQQSPSLWGWRSWLLHAACCAHSGSAILSGLQRQVDTCLIIRSMHILLCAKLPRKPLMFPSPSSYATWASNIFRPLCLGWTIARIYKLM